MATNKKQPKQQVDNTIESLRHMPGDITSSLKKDLAQKGTEDFFAQLFGLKKSEGDGEGQVTKKPLSGEMAPGQEYNLKAHAGAGRSEKPAEKPIKADVAPGIDYRSDILRGSERLATGEKREIQYRVQEIMNELQKLVASSSVLQAEFKHATIAQAPKNAGKYHLNFFDWVLSVVRGARMRIEDSSSWLNAIQSKKGKKGYWNMFKKHGTSFGMSNERNVATQTG